ncbi:MAG: sigma-54 dependent transcriptional regulator, partial [bacterium]|nr:sigma-54 dependent transcriptional regulator [bacterium]
MLKNKVLIIDDEEDICKIVQQSLQTRNIDSEYTLLPSEAIRKLERNEYDIILLDFMLPEMDGFAFIEKVINTEFMKNTRIILMTGYGDIDMGLEAIKRGSFDYIPKPFNMQDLLFRIIRAMEHIKLNTTISILSQSISYHFNDIIGNSQEMKKIFQMISKVAKQDTIVLIQGETGTGKELIAEAVHRESPRKDKVFIPVNCGALSPTLLESELFGYEKGSFTGAASTKHGIMESADQGTVFLDEINNAPPDMQVKLLRFLEKGEFRRVGGNKALFSNVRLVAASNQDLNELIRLKLFREDLYQRVNVVNIVVPPLRQRKEDIPHLIHHFLKIFTEKFKKRVTMDKKVIDLFIQYYWPGNIRQLKNLVQSLVLLNDS